MSDSLRPSEVQHTRLPCPSPTPGPCSNSRPSSWWCHPTISSSVVPFVLIYHSVLGLPWWCRQWRTCLQCGRPRFDPWVGKIPWRRKWQPTPVFLPRESHGQRGAGWVTVHGLCKESDTTKRLTRTHHSLLICSVDGLSDSSVFGCYKSCCYECSSTWLLRNTCIHLCINLWWV